ncbi:hypothetical protein EGY08_07180 [Klebsiella sp. FDAARGOS_511]|nr:hypothetical protein EGY08_07180 [Klebsiella sp. FDAARGOS_511]MBF8461521.1 hypothetical protein [Klebsiella michiganensis]MBZ7658988.1 hypothetical protein [Klebsiella grimontii]PLL95138.1 hypothetical protein CWN68_20590 [Klebsiella michiganensis]
MREFVSTVESPSSLSRLALRLAGLRVRHRLWSGSPGKAFTPQPGKATTHNPLPQILNHR